MSLRLVIVRDTNDTTDHAVLAVRVGERWLLLDDRMLIMIDAMEARHYFLFSCLGVSWCAGVCLRDLGPLNSLFGPH